MISVSASGSKQPNSTAGFGRSLSVISAPAVIAEWNLSLSSVYRIQNHMQCWGDDVRRNSWDNCSTQSRTIVPIVPDFSPLEPRPRAMIRRCTASEQLRQLFYNGAMTAPDFEAIKMPMILPSAVEMTGAPCQEARSDVASVTDHDCPFAVIWSRLML